MSNVDYEPMDIDSSANSCAAMDISYNEIVEQPNQIKSYSKEETETSMSKKEKCHEIKRFHIDRRVQKGNKAVLKSHLYLLIFVIVGIFMSIFYYKVVNFECCHEINTKSLKNDLSSEVHGQSDAVHTLVHSLEAYTSSKILFLYGGTGVGKTLTTSILLDKLSNFSNVYHYTMPSFVDKFTTEIKIGWIFCDKWYIIVDDLDPGDKHIISIVNDTIIKTENLKKNVTIILVYNCDVSNQFIKCSDAFLPNLQETFKSVNVSKYFIKFLPLTEDVLKQCIEDELEQRLVRNVDINMVMKNFNVSHDGCKGVHTKIKSLNLF